MSSSKFEKERNMDKPEGNAVEQAKQVLRIEAEGILNLVDRLGDGFSQMVETIMNSPGRVVISGIGKSGIIARKIVATLNSTGTRSIFLHPVEAMHGDLGTVCRDDVFVALSNSGETDELNMLIPMIRNVGCVIIAFTGRTGSTLAKNSDIVIDVGVEKEACPLGLAPTSSTTACLAMGDALAVVLIDRKHFDSSDFKKYHPGGALGQRLSRNVSDIMLTGEIVPLVSEQADMDEAVREMDRPGMGVTLVAGPDKTLAGIITDGDIRRAIVCGKQISGMPVGEIMTTNPKTAAPDSPAYDALNLMEKYQITVLPIIGPSGEIKGILHLHDILGKGEFKFNGLLANE